MAPRVGPMPKVHYSHSHSLIAIDRSIDQSTKMANRSFNFNAPLTWPKMFLPTFLYVFASQQLPAVDNDLSQNCGVFFAEAQCLTGGKTNYCNICMYVCMYTVSDLIWRLKSKINHYKAKKHHHTVYLSEFCSTVYYICILLHIQYYH